VIELSALVVAAVIVHEAGHAITATALGYPVRPVITWHGPGIAWGSDAVTSPDRHRALVASGGLAATFALMVGAMITGAWLLAAINVDLLFWNLILPRSDGRHAWRALR
jgi:hypothetical protein